MTRQLIPVSSSNLEAVGWSKGTLTVRFTSGATYQYYDVKRSVYQRLLRAESHGKFFSAHIRNNYEFTKLEQE